jgi:hypothetical protein
MFVHVAEAKYVEGYRIWVRFTDGLSGEIDLAGELDGEVFEPLKDPRMFASFKVDDLSGTLVWPNGADFAPEFLHERLAGGAVRTGT